MEYLKPSVRLLYAWWVRLFAITLVPCAVTTVALPLFSLWWNILMAVWLTAFSVFFVWYYPLKYKKLRYAVTDKLVVLNSGVIFTRKKYIYKDNIQFISIDTSVLDSFFGISSVIIRTAGATIWINGIDKEGKKFLQSRLSPYIVGGKGKKHD